MNARQRLTRVRTMMIGIDKMRGKKEKEKDEKREVFHQPSLNGEMKRNERDER